LQAQGSGRGRWTAVEAQRRQSRKGDGALLPGHTFEILKADPAIGRAEALRRARMAMIDSGSQPDFAHPFFWAPFSLVGEGGARR